MRFDTYQKDLDAKQKGIYCSYFAVELFLGIYIALAEFKENQVNVKIRIEFEKSLNDGNVIDQKKKMI